MKYLFVLLMSCSSEQDLNQKVFEYLPSNVDELSSLYKEDMFLHPVGNPADILFVIDKSCSMMDHEDEVNDNISVFFDVLDQYNIDYHIGLTSTDASTVNSAGHFANLNDISYDLDGRNYIIPRDNGPDDFAVMNNLLNFEHQGDGESGLDAIFGALILNLDDHPDFFRPHVPLYIVLISDENDSSYHFNQKQLGNVLYHWSGQENKKVYFSGILTVKNGMCEDQSSSIGEDYFGLIKHFQGKLVDICNPDWSYALSELAYLATPNVYAEYFLSQIPYPETIDVHVTHDHITYSYEDTGSFVYSSARNSVTILNGYIPTEGDLAVINYQIKY